MHQALERFNPVGWHYIANRKRMELARTMNARLMMTVTPKKVGILSKPFKLG